jgi:hypothetical protein
MAAPDQATSLLPVAFQFPERLLAGVLEELGRGRLQARVANRGLGDA